MNVKGLVKWVMISTIILLYSVVLLYVVMYCKNEYASLALVSVFGIGTIVSVGIIGEKMPAEKNIRK